MTRAISNTPPENPFRKDLEAFLSMVFEYCEGFVAVRLLRESGTDDAKPQSRYFEAKEALSDEILRLIAPAANDQRGLYVVPCTVKGRGSAKARDILQTCVIPVDLDTGDIEAKRRHLERHLGPASMIVRSGGLTAEGQHKLHLYWKLTEACLGKDLEKITETRRRLIEAVDADASFQRLTQPIRVPGSIHGKNGVQTRVTIQGSAGFEYDLQDLLEAARQVPCMSGLPPHIDTGNAGGAGRKVEDLQKTRVRAGGQDDISRYAALSKVIGHWVRLARVNRTSLEEAWVAVVDHNQTCIDPPWPEERLYRDFQVLLRLDQQTYCDAWNKQNYKDHDLEEASEPPSGSEDALADLFVAEFGKEWRHVALWGNWLQWQGTYWSADETQLVFHQIRGVVRAAAIGQNARDARKLATSKTFRAVERIASSDPRISTRPSDWDAHNTLLNTPSGVLDLGTGEVLPHDPALLITQSTSISPASSCPTWMAFIDDITGSDAELAAYLARICGYCLTGDTSEQAFFFFHGAGANGKSVFLQTLSKVLGSYAATAPMDSFMVSRSNTHPTDIAGLRGKRLVTVSETEPGRAWAESRIKTITGGDPVRARLLYRDFFEFTPTFKLIVAGNHRPQLTGVGEAMRRRLHLVPFDVTIPEGRRDKFLGQRLERELAGILDWILAGYRDWQKNGLNPPKKVLDASQSYFADEDLVGKWIDESCTVGNDRSETAKSLFASWGCWADDNGVERGSQKTFGEALRSRGFTNAKSRSGWFWRGIAVRRGTPGGEQ